VEIDETGRDRKAGAVDNLCVCRFWHVSFGRDSAIFDEQAGEPGGGSGPVDDPAVLEKALHDPLTEDIISGQVSESRRRHGLYFLVLLAVNAMWAFQFSGAKLATAHLGPITVTALPMLLATALLIPLLAVENRLGSAPRKRIEAWAWRDFVLLAIFGSLPAQLGLVWGVQYSLASNASVLTLTIPVLTAGMAALLLGERMTLLRWISFALAIAGVLIVSDIDWRRVELFKSHYLLGNLLIFASCVGSAFYNSYSKKALEHFSPAVVLTYSFLVVDAILLVLMFAFERPSWAVLSALGSDAWAALLAIAVFSLAVSMVLFFWVIQRIEVTQASLSIYLLPVFGVFFSSVTLHERLRPQLVVGALLVLASTFLVTTYEAN
jgi:drug/metabolite transporter (DMT)-like permease